jgi:hypothetical protein
MTLGHALVSPDRSAQSAQVHTGTLPLGRFGLLGAVTARVWIYQRREPMMLVTWGMVAIIMVAASITALIGTQRHAGVLLLGAVLGAGFLGVFNANAIGTSGPAFIFEAMALSSRRALRDYLTGQIIVRGVIGAPLLAAVSLGLAALAGNMSYGLVGVAVGLAGLGAALGLASIFTVGGGLPGATADRQPDAAAGRGLRVLRSRQHLRQPARGRGGDRPGDHHRPDHERRPGRYPGPGPAAGLGRVRAGAGLGGRPDRGGRGRGEAARAVPDRHRQHALMARAPACCLAGARIRVPQLPAGSRGVAAPGRSAGGRVVSGW